MDDCQVTKVKLGFVWADVDYVIPGITNHRELWVTVKSPVRLPRLPAERLRFLVVLLHPVPGLGVETQHAGFPLLLVGMKDYLFRGVRGSSSSSLPFRHCCNTRSWK